MVFMDVAARELFDAFPPAASGAPLSPRAFAVDSPVAFMLVSACALSLAGAFVARYLAPEISEDV